MHWMREIRGHLARVLEPRTGDGSATALSGMDRQLTRASPLRRYLPYVVAGILALCIAVWLYERAGQSVYRLPVDQVTVATVKRAPFEDFIAVRSAVAPLVTDYLTTEAGGTVKQVLVEDGAVVQAGQPLIVLANPSLELQVAQREADAAGQISNLQNTEVQLEEARFKYEHDLLDIDHTISRLKASLGRDKVLMDGEAIAAAVYESEQADYAYQTKLRAATLRSRDAEQKVHTLQLAQLKEALDRLKANIAEGRASLDALIVRAPVAGHLTALAAEVGQSKPAGAVLGQVDRLGRFKLSAQVDEFYLGKVATGQEALFNVDGKNYTAKIAKIYPQVSNGTFKADFGFVGAAPPNVHNGQAVDLKVELGGAANAITLPVGPFYEDTGGNWIFVVTPDGTGATRRNVRLGRRNPEYVEVLSGLVPGEKAIVSSYDAFQKVNRVEFEAPSGGER
jgi:HlyD family secretion protein